MESQNSNVFDFATPDETRCHVWSYERPRIARLVLKIDEPNTQGQRWIFFEDVDFFHGSMKWKGANFRVESREEQHKLRLSIGQNQIPEDSMNLLLDNNKLYVVEPVNQELAIRILARNSYTSSAQYIDTDFFARDT